MMKYPKKIISLCLVFVMTTSMAAHTTFASSLANSVEPVTTDICILNDDPLNYTVLKSEDFLNGDIIFTLKLVTLTEANQKLPLWINMGNILLFIMSRSQKTPCL